MITKIWTAYLFCTFTWRRDDTHATRERVYQVRSAPMFRVNTNGDIVMGLPDRLTAHCQRFFFKAVLLGCLNNFLQLSGRGCGFKHKGIRHSIKICPAMVEGDISRKADLTWRTDYIISTAERNSDRRKRLSSPSQKIEDLVARQASLTMSDANILRLVRENGRWLLRNDHGLITRYRASFGVTYASTAKRLGTLLCFVPRVTS